MTPEWAYSCCNAHGGHGLRLVDNSAYVCAARYSNKTVCVTAAVDRVDFYEPIYVGELLNLSARINYVGRSSMEVEIDVTAENIATGVIRHTNSCHLTMVAMEEGKPASVPRLLCRTREDKARYVQAKMRREMGLKYREERDRFLKQFEDMSDETLDALIGDAKDPHA